MFNPVPTQDMTYIEIMFDGMAEERLEERHLQTWTQFLANFGGILGLMTGFSLMSLIEVIIYMALYAISKYNQ